jgi:SAM-dependent methyltransferase/uncharacterized protein YbaR (Trm112 family)
MKIQLVRHLACVKHLGPKRNLELDILEVSDGNECTEGFIKCKTCDHLYPIIGGVPLLVENLVEYVSSRPSLLGKWLLSIKTSSMKEYLKEISTTIVRPNGSQPVDVYEEEGSLYKSYNWVQFDFTNEDRFLSLLRWKMKPNELYNKVVHSSATNLDGAALDLGCSSGYTAMQLAKKFAFVVGIDLSFSFISEARKRMSEARQGNLEFVVADCLSPPFLPTKFDLILALNIIELLDVEKLLAIVYGLLKAHGEVVFTSPYDYNRNMSGRRVDPQSFRHLLQRSGFRIGSKYITREDYIPWTLKINDRTYLFYYLDYLRAEKVSTAKG